MQPAEVTGLFAPLGLEIEPPVSPVCRWKGSFLLAICKEWMSLRHQGLLSIPLGDSCMKVIHGDHAQPEWLLKRGWGFRGPRQRPL